MRNALKGIIAAAALAATGVAVAQPAQARDHDGAVVTAGVVGLGLGAAIGSSGRPQYTQVDYYPAGYRGNGYGYGRGYYAQPYGYGRGYRGGRGYYRDDDRRWRHHHRDRWDHDRRDRDWRHDRWR